MLEQHPDVKRKADTQDLSDILNDPFVKFHNRYGYGPDTDTVQIRLSIINTWLNPAVEERVTLIYRFCFNQGTTDH
jgi:hypothetical protein